MKETNWIRPAALENRVDAEFYKAEFIALADRLAQIGISVPLESIWAEKNRIYIGIAGFESIDDPASYTPYLRPVDITKDGHIDYNNLPWCERHWFDEYGDTGCAKEGDLIVEVKGNTKKSGVVSSRIPSNCIVSGSAYRIQLSDQVDTHFVQAYFLSDSGQLLKRRYCSNTTINYLDPDSFRNLSVPLPNRELQLAIGNKIRKAERLRELAEDRVAAARNQLQHLLDIKLSPAVFEDFEPGGLRSTDYRCLKRQPAIALADVYDEIGAQYFHPRRIFAKKIALAHAGEKLARVAKRIGKFGGSSEALFLGLDAISSSNGIIDFDSLQCQTPSAGESSFQGNDIIFSRLRPYLNKVSVFPEGKAPCRGSGELIVYRSKGIDPYYLMFVLRSEVGLYQIIDVTSGSTHPRVDADVLDQTIVPRFGSELEEEIGSNVRLAHKMWYEAALWSPEAKADVEALIDGSLDESRLLEESPKIEQWLKDNPAPSH